MEPPLTPPPPVTTSRNVRWLRAVALVEIVSGLLGVSAIPYLLAYIAQRGAPVVGFQAALSVASLVGGVLLWGMKDAGWKVSACLQAVQTPYFASRAFLYSIPGLSFVLKTGWMGSDGLPTSEVGATTMSQVLVPITFTIE